MAAELVGEAGDGPGAPMPDGELAEVRWVSLGEVDDLMRDAVYKPVIQHLRRVLDVS